MNEVRVVFDTNTLISAVLLAQSIPDRAFQVARSSCSLLFSDTTFDELQQVITRTKFDKYVSMLNPFRDIKIVTPAQFLSR